MPDPRIVDAQRAVVTVHGAGGQVFLLELHDARKPGETEKAEAAERMFLVSTEEFVESILPALPVIEQEVVHRDRADLGDVHARGAEAELPRLRLGDWRVDRPRR